MENATIAPAEVSEQQVSSDVIQGTNSPSVEEENSETVVGKPTTPQATAAPAVNPLKAAIVAGKPTAPVASKRVVPASLDKMVTGTTADLGKATTLKKFSCLIYGDTNSHKTVLAATYGTPRDLMIISTRNPEQLVPLIDDDYFYVFVRDEDELENAIVFYDVLWERERKAHPDRRGDLLTLVIDDLTEGIGILQEGSKINEQGKEVRDIRRTFYEAGDDLSHLINRGVLRNQRVDLVVTALQRESKSRDGIEIVPDIPPKMRAKIEADFSNVFYIDGDYAFITDKTKKVVPIENPKTGKMDLFIEVRTFAKHKHPFRRKALNIKEKCTLRELADKITASFVEAEKDKVRTPSPSVMTAGVTKTPAPASNKK